ncbi:MAG: hypothetical protein H7326_12075 [Bdellovibrionaceae bacterium]|nr:hypothetical protein [Pseudobdellovibrionaceae bacterium]
MVCGISTAVAVAGGGCHSLFLLSNGTVWAAGWNGSGQLGNNNTSDQLTPVTACVLTSLLGSVARVKSTKRLPVFGLGSDSDHHVVLSLG